jgi:hypothetical protein
VVSGSVTSVADALEEGETVSPEIDMLAVEQAQ